MTITKNLSGGVVDGDQLFSVNEVAERLKMSTATIRRWIALKRLVAHKLGRPGAHRAEWRISETEIQRYLAKGKSPR